MIGDSMEDVGFELSQRPAVMQAMAERAVLLVPLARRAAGGARLGRAAGDAA